MAYGYAFVKAYGSAFQSGHADERPYLYAYGSATIGGMSYDLTNLEKLGRRVEKLRAELAELLPQVRAEVQAAIDAGARQVDVAHAARYTRDAVYKIGRRPGGTP